MEKKTCTKCEVSKPVSEFYWRKERNAYRSKCKQCEKALHSNWRKKTLPERREKHREWCKANPEKARANWNRGREKKRQALKEWVWNLKKAPCMDCGQTFHPVCMDFDHRPDTDKIADVSVGVSKRWSKEKLLVEIAKCDLVCSNCHRMRTFVQRG